MLIENYMQSIQSPWRRRWVSPVGVTGKGQEALATVRSSNWQDILNPLRGFRKTWVRPPRGQLDP